MTRLASVTLLLLMPAAVFAETISPSIGYTGAPADHNGQNCSACHTGNPLNDSSGSLQVMVSDYTAYSTQLIRILIQNANAERFGFQITIRALDTPSASAGTFSLATPPGPVQIVCDDGTQYGSTSGCTNTPLRLFAEHHNAPGGAATKPFEFDVNWTPPAEEVGRIAVYVAAVAANGDNTPLGDYVYTSVTILNNVGACDDTDVPAITTVVNGASFQSQVSSLAMVTLNGSNFHLSGFPRTAGPGDYVGNAYPTELGCISIQAGGPDLANPVLLPIAYVDTYQINAQMPEFMGAGPLTLSVIANPGEPNQLKSPVATLSSIPPFAPAFFLLPKSTSIAAEEAETGAIVADASVVPGASPAKPGDIVALFGTGFGDTNPLVAAGQMASGVARLTNSITVTIGGTTLDASDVLYAGLSPGSISGLYQINVRIPSTAPSGDVPVTISIGGIETQSGATIPIQ
ncbi:MAG: choice-of-anchor V domain-containing protein [Bryobacteraceae bacterium]